MKRKLTVFVLLALLVTVLVLPAQAAPQLSQVTDAAELLSYDEWEVLEVRCARLTQQYGCGVYIITVDDFENYGDGDVFETTYGLYHQYELGAGDARDGLVLLLSMNTREFALFVYGDRAEYAFDAYGQMALEQEFLPFFGEDDWYGGFSAYATACESYLEQAAAGTPVREPVRASFGEEGWKFPGFGVFLAVLISFFVSFIVCSILNRGMKNVFVKGEAGAYVSGDLDLTAQYDQITHTTVSRTKVESSSSSSRSGGGGSGRSGHF